MNPIRFGLIANTGKERVAEVLPPFLEWLRRQNIPFVLASEIGALFDTSAYPQVPAADIADSADLILSFGGDGTFLQTARLIAPREVPIIGVNLGGFGYLAEVGIDELEKRMLDILNNNYQIQRRFMLEAQIPNDAGGRSTESTNKDYQIYYGLNDIVVDKGGFPRTIHLETFVDGVHLNTFNADGLIVATATGSTGYSLSVGGPILEPCVEGMIIDPISPHMLANRPIVLGPKRVIKITVTGEMDRFLVAVDGQSVASLPSGAAVTIQQAPFVTRLAVFPDYDFYGLLRNKLHWRTQHE
ncbi:MAG: NAD(+)/NADH kinase [Calditrichota bacterium]